MNQLIITVFVFYLVELCDCKYYYRTEYINVKIDHFSFTNNRTFPLRYLINDDYWKPDKGPIFFYTGNEGPIEMFAENTGFLWESAAVFDALVVFAEHRYYGKSLPFGDISLKKSKYFRYLTSEQALADFVDLIYHLQKYKKNDTSTKIKTNAVIAFGGSYGGMLAAWMRIKYPAVIEGALASSAPIWYFTGMTSCNAFYESVTKVFNHICSVCVNNIKKLWHVLDHFMEKENGKKWINKNWKLCKPIKTAADANTFIGWIEYVYIIVAMVNYPYPTNFIVPVPANPVKEICKHLNSSSLSRKNLLKAAFKAVSVYFNSSGSAKCLEWSSYSESDLGIDGWNIQECTEMVMPYCTNGISDMFRVYEWNFKNYADYCYKKYKVYPDPYKIEKTYGGKKIRTASNIIFSNGLLDPWMSGGVTKSISKSVIAVVLAESAHHLDLRSAHKNDPKSVMKARKFYHILFRKWIRKYQ